MLDHLGIAQAHLCGLSMGGYAVLHFALTYPERAGALVVAGCGNGSGDRDAFRRDSSQVVKRFEDEGMARVADWYSRGPTRVQFLEEDQKGWQEFHGRLAAGSARGHALTMQGVQMNCSWSTTSKPGWRRSGCRRWWSPATRTSPAWSRPSS